MFSRKPSQPVKSWQLIFLGIIIVSSIALSLYYRHWPKIKIKINEQTYSVLLANNTRHHFIGLSNRKDLGKYDGMLFVFANRVQHTFVMRNMLFPIDIVWLNKGEIVDIAPNIQPEPGKNEASLTPYFARLPSDMVLELVAGTVAKNGLKIGDKLEILD